MKSAYIILYHNSKKESLSVLRSLISDLKNTGRKIIVASHSSIPQDLIEDCAGYIYDPDNHLEDHSSQMVYWEKTDFFTIYSPFLFYGSLNHKSYCFAANKNFLNSLDFAYQLGYDVAHILEYDALIRAEEFEENEVLIRSGNHDCILYNDATEEMSGTYLCLALKNYDTRWDIQKIREHFAKYQNRCERGSYKMIENWIGVDRIKIKEKALGFQQQVCSGQDAPHVVLFEQTDCISVFIQNWTDKVIHNINLYCPNGKIHLPQLESGVWHLFKVSEKKETLFFHMFVGENLVRKWDIDTEEDYKKIIGKNLIERNLAQ